MIYFSTHYPSVAYPAPDRSGGLYLAQLGAIHAIASHFTVHDDAAIITMPTGSGKTAVLMMTPFVLRKSRVLVITPSRLVREQIAEDFQGLRTLRIAKVVPDPVPSPKVYELKQRITAESEWESLSKVDVVVSTPQCASPSYAQIPPPPRGLFDLLLVDEAHHAPAATWRELLGCFTGTPTVLFTATPFRRDRAEIPGRFVYTYSIAKAYADKIFGKIEYVPVERDGASTPDVLVAKATAEVFTRDRAAGLEHYVMVRTDRVARAGELAAIYAKHTTLRLAVVSAKLSNKTVRRILDDLDRGELDGIVCVSMLGEGFNFPKMKIAAIHAPHRSLEVTLQFIGRFARTNASGIGTAKFLALKSDIEVEGQKLFQDGRVWQDIVIGLSEGRIADEAGVREVLQTFDRRSAATDDLGDLSLYSLYPRPHVKIFDISGAVDLNAPLKMPSGFSIVLRTLSGSRDTLVLVLQDVRRPKWSETDRIVSTNFELTVVYFDRSSRLLFVSCTESSGVLYEAISKAMAPSAKALPTSLVRRVAKGIANPNVFNLGIRNIQATNRSESYRIVAGASTQTTITASDARLYRQGHVFMSGVEGEEKVNIGYSSGSKVWAASQMQIPHLLDWCRALGQKIRSVGEIVTNTGLDYLAGGEVVTSIPEDVVYVRWDREAFDAQPPCVRYEARDRQVFAPLVDLELLLDRSESESRCLRLVVLGEDLTYRLRFTLEEFFTAVDDGAEEPVVVSGGREVPLVDYLNIHYPDFFTATGALFTGNELYRQKVNARPIADDQFVEWVWEGVDITKEVNAGSGHCSVHERVLREIEAQHPKIAVYDHGTGEIADFVVLTSDAGTLVCTFYHCKGSGGAEAGARVDDLYEVCGQAQKSIAWINDVHRLTLRIEQRQTRNRFAIGSHLELVRLLAEHRDCPKRFRMVVVQPGVKRARLSQAMAETLGATNDHIVKAGCEPLRVVVSA